MSPNLALTLKLNLMVLVKNMYLTNLNEMAFFFIVRGLCYNKSYNDKRFLLETCLKNDKNLLIKMLSRQKDF